MWRFALLVPVVAALATTGGEAATPPRGLILFWTESPAITIWAVRPDGSHRSRIVRNNQNAKRPRLSPDRRWVVFDGTPPGKPPMSDFDVQLIRLDGTGLRTVTTSSDWDNDAEWSPDGRWLSFGRSPPSPQDCSDASIWIVRRDGSDPRRVVAGCGARWSPDGTRLVYATQTKVDGRDRFTIDTVAPDGSGAQTLLESAVSVQPAGWSRRGKILFTRSYDQSGRNGAVLVMNADGTGVRKLANGFASCWSPDGSKILYTPTALQSPVLVMDADGSHKRSVFGVVGSDPSWR
jgi:Tol biopolymer transport system component